MTTIAYKDGIIAYDSREVDGGLIMTDEANKHVIIDGVHFFLTGSTHNFKEFYSAYASGGGTLSEGNDCMAFVVDDRELLLVTAVQGILRKCPVTCPDAIGSGYVTALAYTTLGMSAKDAVEATKKMDINTGGIIHEFHIPSPVVETQ